MPQTENKYRDRADRFALPKHIAIIMDGNGRWAQLRGLPREQGHAAGAEALGKVYRAAASLGIPYLTVYAFSTENWGRPKEEVDALMSLLVTTIEQQLSEMEANNVHLLAVGDLDRLPQASRQALQKAIDRTRDNQGLTLVIALSYSARWEITEAVKRIVGETRCGARLMAQVTEELISSYLTTSELPDPDLLIRTGGEQRISNFLLWQLAYAELYFTPIYWPDFDGEALLEAITEYNRRERRYGLTSDQIKCSKQD
ncbi:MAG: isoprenyl transferase [Porphyromonas sp.]|nr:isoprenyl transferase [Porphyromonas sp.]